MIRNEIALTPILSKLSASKINPEKIAHSQKLSKLFRPDQIITNTKTMSGAMRPKNTPGEKDTSATAAMKMRLKVKNRWYIY